MANVILLSVPLWIVLGTTVFAWRFRRTLRAAWREPVLRRPVMVFESDDWGPGAAGDGQALNRLADILAGCRDSTGRAAVMTIGVVLAVPDTRSQVRPPSGAYVRRLLDDAGFADVRAALSGGEESGVFALQLHGMEHYWPPAIITAAKKDEQVQKWLSMEGAPRTERLPDRLQTRWADCTVLPSKPIEVEHVRAAVAEEVLTFRRIFGRAPKVVVPPTFVWTDTTERAWAENGLQVIVTPGMQYTGRDEQGKLRESPARFWSGQRSSNNLVRIVRDAYFEPAFGHHKEAGLKILADKTRRGQATLFETHRFNFLADLSADAEGAFAEFKGLLDEALRRFPELVFRSTWELAMGMAQGDDPLIERRLRYRVAPVARRVRAVPGLRKWALLSGAAVPAAIVIVVAGLSCPAAFLSRRNNGPCSD